MSDIVNELREIAKTDPSEWRPHAALAVLLQEAADTIESLRSISGKAAVGPSFAQTISGLPHRSQEPAKPA